LGEAIKQLTIKVIADKNGKSDVIVNSVVLDYRSDFSTIGNSETLTLYSENIVSAPPRAAIFILGCGWPRTSRL